ncbi:MAG: putative bifunctional diguanylate cyclase/phosphodiesterase [Sphingomonas sp.]
MRLSLLVLLLAVVAGLITAATGAGIGLERTLRMGRESLRQHHASGRYVLVEIDARSLDKLDHWPWPRSLYAEAIEALERAGVSTIAFDVDFSAHSSADQDAAFASAIAHAKVPIVLSTFRQSGSLAGGAMLENMPIDSLRPHAQLAAVNVTADSDGLVRHYLYGVSTGGVPRPSVGAMLAGAAGRVDASFPIDGAIDPTSVPRISFVDLIDGNFPAAMVRGKAVLIGGTAIELGDRFSVPRHGVIPGPVIQLLAAETLSAGGAGMNFGPLLPLVLALIVLILARRCAPEVRVAVFGGGFAVILALPLVLEAAHIGTVQIVPGLVTLWTGIIAAVIEGTVGVLRTARLVDPASGLPNRRGFEQATRRMPVASVTVLRITNYSDAAGVIGQAHAAEMIRRVVDRLTAAGIAPLYRLEEGVLAWTAEDGAAEARVHEAEGVAALLRVPVEVAGRQLDLDCRLGLALGDATLADADALADRAILAADHALEKDTRWEMHSLALGEEQDWRLTLAGELDQAMAAGDLWVAYQPKLDIASGRVVAAEALVRWRHPVRGPIPPDAFIPALESSRRMLDLTLFVLRRAAEDAGRWRAAGLPINVAVNVSALLTSNETFLAAINDLLERGVVTPDQLTLEVTESAAMTDPDRQVAALERITARGIKISIDDYGTGQSTLTYLKRLPAREIKIDKSFVLGLESSRSDQAMVRSTIELAHELGYAVVAEGVETAAILGSLADMGCDTAQGWHIGKPMPAEEFTARFGTARQAA